MNLCSVRFLSNYPLTGLGLALASVGFSVSPAQAILNGTDIDDDVQAQIGLVRFVNAKGQGEFCTGTHLENNLLPQISFVLTAAHCNGTSLRFQPGGDSATAINSMRAIPHPNFNFPDQGGLIEDDDLMLFKIPHQASLATSRIRRGTGLAIGGTYELVGLGNPPNAGDIQKRTGSFTIDVLSPKSLKAQANQPPPANSPVTKGGDSGGPYYAPSIVNGGNAIAAIHDSGDGINRSTSTVLLNAEPLLRYRDWIDSYTQRSIFWDNLRLGGVLDGFENDANNNGLDDDWVLESVTHPIFGNIVPNDSWTAIEAITPIRTEADRAQGQWLNPNSMAPSVLSRTLSLPSAGLLEIDQRWNSLGLSDDLGIQVGNGPVQWSGLLNSSLANLDQWMTRSMQAQAGDVTVYLLFGPSAPIFNSGASAGGSSVLPLPISFSVDGGAFNPLRNGINAPIPNPADGLAVPPAPDPNDVWALGTAPGSRGYATEGEIFQSSGAILGLPPDGTNVDRMSSALGIGPCPGGPPYVGPFNPNPGDPLSCPPPPGGPLGTFGLQPNDNIISSSYGMDSGEILQFSVDPDAQGLPGTDVFIQASADEAAGDIFKTPEFEPFGSYILDHIVAGHVLSPANKLNDLYRDERELGLQGSDKGDNGEPATPDDLDGFEEADTGDPFWGVDIDVNGIVDFEKFSFFSLDEVSPSLGGPFTSDDIFVTTAPGFNFGIYADGVLDIKLLPGDILDALALSDIGGFGFGPSGNAPNGILNPGADEALFSLVEDSPSLLNFGVSPGDVFYTDFIRPFNPLLRWTEGGSLYARHDEIGLEFDDELNALDIKPSVPEPSSIIGLFALGGLGLTQLRKKRQ
ncbi:MAG: trypsin-like serine protease [Crocosphaera sp.]|nr:trypsin-like serine protease [Crocosphaera sp.]